MHMSECAHEVTVLQELVLRSAASETINAPSVRPAMHVRPKKVPGTYIYIVALSLNEEMSSPKTTGGREGAGPAPSPNCVLFFIRHHSALIKTSLQQR
jgi:hypothetical protein